MNKIMQHVITVPCPKCGAKAGEKCNISAMPRFNYCCHVRYLSAPISTGPVLGCSSVKLRGSNPSHMCSTSRHSKCKGRHARNHGVKGELCTCICHAGKKRD